MLCLHSCRHGFNCVFQSGLPAVGLIVEHASTQLCCRLQDSIPYFRSGLKGVARSMPTSAALDRCAACGEHTELLSIAVLAAGPESKTCQPDCL